MPAHSTHRGDKQSPSAIPTADGRSLRRMPVDTGCPVYKMVLVHPQSLVVRPGSSPCIPVPAAPPNPGLAALCLLGANLHTKRCVFLAGQQWHCPGPVFLEAWIENGSLGSHIHKCPPCCSHWLHFGEAAASSCVLRTF